MVAFDDRVVFFFTAQNLALTFGKLFKILPLAKILSSLVLFTITKLNRFAIVALAIEPQTEASLMILGG